MYYSIQLSQVRKQRVKGAWREFYVGEALIYLNRMWGTEDFIMLKNSQPQRETSEGLLYRHELKDLLQEHASESRITSATAVGSLKMPP